MKRSNAVALWCSLTVALLVGADASLRAEEGATMGAMQVAYSREVNARIQYLAYANRADLEGQPSVACLFRAVASAESIHEARHAAVIEQMNGTPRYQPEALVVLRTRQNLTNAILGELQERWFVYPRLADYARSENLYEALASCNYAKGAEATHERVFRAALWRLENEEAKQVEFRIASLEPVLIPVELEPPSTYFVCPGDGCVFAKSVARCPSCGTAGDQIVPRSCER